MKSSMSNHRIPIIGLALTLALVGCSGGEEKSSQGPEKVSTQATSQEAEPQAPDTKTIATAEDQAVLAKELAESQQQARSKQEAVDPEVAKRMQDPEYRKQKDQMLNQLSQVSTRYFKQGIEIRRTRKRPEWRLVDPKLAEVSDPAERRKQGEELAKRFKGEIEPILDKAIAVKVFADASESIEVY